MAVTQGNKAKARSTCSAGSLSSMLSSETDEDSLSAGASNSQNSSAGVSGGGGGGGGVDKGGQMSHNAARHKIAIKPKKNHGRTRPVRATPTEPSLPATPEERVTPSMAHDDETSGGTASAVSSRPMSTDEEMTSTFLPLGSARSATPTASQKSSPLPESGGNIIVTGAPSSAAVTGGVDLRPASLLQQSHPEKRRSTVAAAAAAAAAAALLDETPEPVIIGLPTLASIQMGSGGASGGPEHQQTVADTGRQDVSPKRRPTGGVALVSVPTIHGGALGTTCRSLGSPVQRSKSMKTESADGFRAGQGLSEVSPGGRPRCLRPVSQAGGERPEFDPDTRDSKTPLSAQSSPVKRGLNVSSDFFQRSKSFSAKVSETHQALGKNDFELNNPNVIDDVVVVVDVRESIRSLERRKRCSPTGQSGTAGVSIEPSAGGGGGGGGLPPCPAVLIEGTALTSAVQMGSYPQQHQQHPFQQQQQPQHYHGGAVTHSVVSAASDDPAKDCQGVRRREVDEEKDNNNKVTLAGSGVGHQPSAFTSSGAKSGPTVATSVATSERPRSELLDGVELRRPRGAQSRLSPDDASGAQPNQLQQQQSTITSSFAGEPELFKVFARRSLKQKPGPHDEKQDTETEKETIASRASQQQENRDKELVTREGRSAGHKLPVLYSDSSSASVVKSGITQIRSITDAKRVSEPQIGQSMDHSSSTALTTGLNPVPVELLPSKKELSKIKVGAIAPLKDKEPTVPLSHEAGGLTSQSTLRRETDQLRKQQSLAQPPSCYQPEPLIQSGQVSQGGPRNHHTPVATGQTAPGGQQPSSEKRASAVLLQRTSSVAVRGSEDNNAADEDNARMGGGTGGQDSGQPEWLRLAQKKREKRELKERMDNTSVAANNVANVHDSATNNKHSSGNNSVGGQEATSTKPSTGLRSSKVLDLVSNFQKLQMA
ncbi:hypothetical protein BIW11_11866 [Tropilaelaps mercedesae]|uniref:Uncharacterized protein n=1 Tax=Tropilaelaps mercedesae TaxID=418985 RepID=A0A1V9X9N9_9ACAR|nr:hypothetical protein BIW11_11866 [Tropilaelaps mercedesae]